MLKYFGIKKNYYQFASEAYASGDWDVALKYIKKAIKQSPNNPEFLLLFANIFYIKEDYTAAEQIYQKILSDDPSNWPATINCCDIYIIQKKFSLSTIITIF